MAFIDPSLYAGKELPLTEIPSGTSEGPVPVEQKQVPFSEVLPSTDPLVQENASIRAAASREKASVADSFMAAAQLTDTAKIMRSIFSDDDDDGPVLTAEQAASMIKHSGETYSLDDRNYLLDAKTQTGMLNRMERIKEQRSLQQVAGDNMITSMAVYALDPVQVVAGFGIGRLSGVGKLAKLSRAEQRAATARQAFGMAPVETKVAAPLISRGTAVAASAAVPVAIEAMTDDQYRTEGEMLMEMVASGIGAHYSYRPGQGMVKKDLDYPDTELSNTVRATDTKYKLVEREVEVDEIIPAHMKTEVVGETTIVVDGVEVSQPILKTVEVPDQVVRKKVTEAKFEEVPPELAPGKTHEDPSKIVPVVDKLVEADKPRGWASKLYWNMHNTMSSMGQFGKEVADLFYDNNSNLAKNSVESVRQGVLTDLKQFEQLAHDDVLSVLKEQGHGVWNRLFKPKQAAAAQDKLMTQVQREMDRQMNLFRQGKPITADGVDPKVYGIAEKYNAVHKRALEEMQRAGVKGAEGLEYTPGYYSRKWSSYKVDQIIQKFSAAGRDGEQAVKRLVAASVQKANPGMTNVIAYDIGASIINRAVRKGEFEDMLFAVPAGEGQLKLMRDILKEEVSAGNLTHARMERVLDVMRQQSEDAGKSPFLKHRTVLDTEHGEHLGGEWVQVSDLFDNRLETSVGRYLDRVSTQVAFAQKGLGSVADIDALRSKFLKGVPINKRGEAEQLFDNTINQWMGRPTGEAMNETMRLMSAYNRAITLGMSGVWQFAEMSTMMGRYGLLKTMKYALKEFPGIRAVVQDTSKANARSLQNILTYHAEQNLRLKPFMYRFEDNFDLPADAGLQLAAQQVNQLVPYANGMKYIQNWQARTATNLIVDRLEKAAKGNSKAAEMLSTYGLEPGVVDKIAVQMERHGWDVDKWDDAVWNSTRPVVSKMMDEIVLKSRLGDTPAFVQFDKAGKFIFTYRNFILTAHNKLMAGGIERNGIGATGLIMMYQLPLAALAVNTASILKGEGPLSPEDMAKKAGAQLSILGLFAEAYKIATGQMTSAGAPALIAVDRWMQVAGSAAKGDFERTAGLIPQVTPLLGVIPFTKGVSKTFTED